MDKDGKGLKTYRHRIAPEQCGISNAVTGLEVLNTCINEKTEFLSLPICPRLLHNVAEMLDFMRLIMRRIKEKKVSIGMGSMDLSFGRTCVHLNGSYCMSMEVLMSTTVWDLG